MRMRTNIDKPWFKKQMDELGLSVRGMAPLIGVHFTALSRTLNGERKLQIDEARKIAEVFRKPVDEILAHSGSSSTRRGSGDERARKKLPENVSPGFMEAQVNFQDPSPADDQHEEYVVPPTGSDPLFGCMAGTLTLLPHVDYTAPADPDWGKVYDD